MGNSDNETIEKRKKNVINFLKEKKEWITYLILAGIVFIGFYIRTRNIPKLKDVTTGAWTLAPDLDPFLFLRWAKYIVAHGHLMVLDTMRYVPLGYDTSGEMKLLAYMVAWFYHILAFFDKSVTVTYAAIWFPVIAFVFTTIMFFLFANKLFYKEKKGIRIIIALIATGIFVLIPSLLPRTIAGIPEKESIAFGFMFLAFYLFLEAYTSEKLKNKIMFGIASGIATAMMALVWGGVIFVWFTIPAAILFSFILGKIKRDEIIIYFSWLATSLAFIMPFTTRYSIKNIVTSTSTGWAIGVLIMVSLSFLLIKSSKFEKLRKKTNISKEIFALIISMLVLFAIVLIVFGPSLFLEQIGEVKTALINSQPSRFGLTVAENKQPYFINDWKDNFGPVVKNIPLFFGLFFFGAIVLFHNLIKNMNRKEKITLTFSYFIFLICLIFSKYSSGSILDGTSGLSFTVYFSGWLFLISTFGYYYHKRHIMGEASVFHDFNFAYILYFIVLTLGIIGSRAGIRLIMVLGAISPIAMSFLIVKSANRYINEKEDVAKLFFGGIALIIIIASIFTCWVYYQSDVATASNYAPSAYNIQWQKAMSWVRDNTPINAVFAHWWDYGYWVQSIGDRATVLDGGNAIGYWDYLMGRLVLTGTEKDEQQALEFLYTHNTTHFLIDSTEIGKYAAFSSIGSDENYDRISSIPTLLMDTKQTKKISNETTYVYPAGFSNDDDIIINDNGNQVLLPRRAAGIGAVILNIDQGKVLQPQAIFIYKGKQYSRPLRYAYVKNNLYDFGSGIDAGVFVFPNIENSGNGQMGINDLGAMLYLSGRTVHSNVARLYLFNQDSENFKLVHTESNLLVDNIKQQKLNPGEFIYYQGFQGPIKIWEIKYPSNIKANPEYLKKDFADPKVDIAKSGEY